MKIIGIDPGSHRIGYAILEKEYKIQILDYGVIEVPKSIKVPYNLLYIKEEILKLIKSFQINFASIEEMFFNKNLKTASRVFEARGVILLTLLEQNLNLTQPTVTQIKKGITGNGRANKKDIHNALKKIFCLEELKCYDDAWDAIATAFVGISIFSNPFRMKP